MSRTLTCLLAACVLLPVHEALAQKHPSGPFPIAELTDSIRAGMTRESVLGLSIAIVAHDSVLWSAGFGYTDTSRTHAVTPATLFSLQSISKTYTAVGFLLARERGWFGLDDLLRRYWPSFQVRSRTDSAAAGRITFRQLLAHRSGLPHEAPVGNNFDDCRCPFSDHIASIKDAWLLAPPGERYAYSNLGFDLVAWALQRRAGSSFADYMQRSLFAPLGMRHSTFDFDVARTAPSFARGQVDGSDAPVMAVPMTGAGGMYSTVLDMARFLRFMLAGGRWAGHRILASRQLADMSTVQFPLPGQELGGYGLGVQINRRFGGVVLSHAGGGYGYTTQQTWIPAYGVGVVVLSNDGGNGELAGAMADLALRRLLVARLGQLPAEPRASWQLAPGVPVERSTLDQVAGSYRAYGGLRTFVVTDSGLQLVTGGGTRMLRALSATDFTDGFDLFRFQFGADGHATGALNIGDNGQDFLALNERPGEPVGPDKPEWARYIGAYQGRSYGQPTTSRIFLRNGYLYSETRRGSRLLEYAPDTFFTAWGESVEFHGDSLRLRGAPFVRVP